MYFNDFPLKIFSVTSNRYFPEHRDNRLSVGNSYVFSNETGADDSLTSIARQPTDERPLLHIGFGFWFNFDLIAKRKSSYAIILDIDPNLTNYFYCFSVAIRQSISRIDFIELFIALLRRYKLTESIQMIHHETHLRALLISFLTKAESWLSTAANYQFIKEMFLTQKIAFSLFDITDNSKHLDIASWLENKTFLFSLDTLYLTNIYEWLCNHGNFIAKKAYQNFIQYLLALSNRLIVVDAFYPIQGATPGTGPPQRVSIGRMPNLKKESHRISLATRQPIRIGIRHALVFDSH